MLDLDRLQRCLLPNLDPDGVHHQSTLSDVDTLIYDMCPSYTVRNYWREIGWQPSLKQLVIMAVHGHSFDLHQIRWMLCLQKLADGELRQQIDTWLSRVENYLQVFQETDDCQFFDIIADTKDDGVVHYSTRNFDEALIIAQTIRHPQKIEISKREFTGKDDLNEECNEYSDDNIGYMVFGKDGFVESFWDYKVCLEEINDTIPNEDFFVPHSYHQGDVVRCFDFDGNEGNWGIVHGVFEGQSAEEKYKKRKCPATEFEEQLIVELMDDNGTFGHWHCHPYNVEKLEDDNSSRYQVLETAGMVISGKAYLQELSMFKEKYLQDK